MSKHTPLPWVAVEGDTFNPDRPWGVSRYMSLDQCKEIDGEDAEPNTRTEVIAEIMDGPDGQAEADARFIIRAVNAHDDLLKALQECHEFIRSLLNVTHDLEAVDFLANNGESVEETAFSAIAKATGESDGP